MDSYQSKLYFTSIVDTVRGNDGFKWLWLLSKIESVVKEQIHYTDELLLIFNRFVFNDQIYKSKCTRVSSNNSFLI